MFKKNKAIICSETTINEVIRWIFQTVLLTTKYLHKKTNRHPNSFDIQAELY